MLTSLSPTGIQIWDVNLGSTAQWYWATFSSVMFPKLFWISFLPQESLNLKGFFFHIPGTDKEWHLLLFWLWHPNFPQWGRSHHPPDGRQKMLEKTKCYPCWQGGPFFTSASTQASFDLRRECYSLRFLFLWPTSSSESPESLPSSSSPSSSSSSSLIKPFRLPCSSWSSRFSSSSSSSGK